MFRSALMGSDESFSFLSDSSGPPGCFRARGRAGWLTRSSNVKLSQAPNQHPDLSPGPCGRRFSADAWACTERTPALCRIMQRIEFLWSIFMRASRSVSHRRVHHTEVRACSTPVKPVPMFSECFPFISAVKTFWGSAGDPEMMSLSALRSWVSQWEATLSSLQLQWPRWDRRRRCDGDTRDSFKPHSNS